jgi:hypothetical protein
MKLKTIYLFLCLLGTILPYWQFLPWLAENDPNVPLFFAQLFANRIAAFFAIDVFVSGAVLLVFVCAESARIHVRAWWLPLMAAFTVGVSLGLPMFLYLRELKLEEART